MKSQMMTISMRETPRWPIYSATKSHLDHSGEMMILKLILMTSYSIIRTTRVWDSEAIGRTNLIILIISHRKISLNHQLGLNVGMMRISKSMFLAIYLKIMTSRGRTAKTKCSKAWPLWGMSRNYPVGAGSCMIAS